MVETYKKIEGIENYSVSDFGNVRNDKTGRILKPGVNSTGYYTVSLTQDKRKATRKIHRLVARAFLLNPDNKPQVDHIDNNQLNNNLNNIRWVTLSENMQNTTKRSNNTSGTKGVCWSEKKQKWRAYITINGKQINLGSFINKDEAVNIRIQRAKDEFGEFINKCELVITLFKLFYLLNIIPT